MLRNAGRGGGGITAGGGLRELPSSIDSTRLTCQATAFRLYRWDTSLGFQKVISTLL